MIFILLRSTSHLEHVFVDCMKWGGGATLYFILLTEARVTSGEKGVPSALFCTTSFVVSSAHLVSVCVGCLFCLASVSSVLAA
jgi:hypothetical protein